jgi:isoleucyl-tRNA synthetase
MNMIFQCWKARFVTTEQGTGIVHCAPSHGPDDFNLCLNHGIKAIETVDGDGKYTKNVHLFEGNHIFKANPIVIEKLKEQKKLLANGELIHSILIHGDLRLHWYTEQHHNGLYQWKVIN